MKVGQLYCGHSPPCFASFGRRVLVWRLWPSDWNVIEMAGLRNDFPTHPALWPGSGAGRLFCLGAGEWTHSSSLFQTPWTWWSWSKA